MTYRDNEDALRARVEALESQKAEAALDHEELSAELAQARLDLSAVQKTAAEARAPRWMLMAGGVGAVVAAASGMKHWVIGSLPAEVNLAVTIAYSVCLGIGLLGLYRASGSRLMQAAAWLCFFKSFVALAISVLLQFEVWSGPWYFSWGVFILSDAFTGVALLKAGTAPAGLRKVCGVVHLVEAGVALRCCP